MESLNTNNSNISDTDRILENALFIRETWRGRELRYGVSGARSIPVKTQISRIDKLFQKKNWASFSVNTEKLGEKTFYVSRNDLVKKSDESNGTVQDLLKYLEDCEDLSLAKALYPKKTITQNSPPFQIIKDIRKDDFLTNEKKWQKVFSKDDCTITVFQRKTDNQNRKFYIQGQTLGKGTRSTTAMGAQLNFLDSTRAKHFTFEKRAILSSLDTEYTTNQIEYLQKLKDTKGIIQYYDHFKSPNAALVWIVEQFGGQSLYDKLRHGSLKESEQASISWQLFQIQKELVTKDVDQGDQKPDNLVIDADNTVRIIDFDRASTLSETAECLGGTINYMSPNEHIAAECNRDRTKTEKQQDAMFSHCLVQLDVLTNGKIIQSKHGLFPWIINPQEFHDAREMRQGIRVYIEQQRKQLQKDTSLRAETHRKILTVLELTAKELTTDQKKQELGQETVSAWKDAANASRAWKEKLNKKK